MLGAYQLSDRPRKGNSALQLTQRDLPRRTSSRQCFQQATREHVQQLEKDYDKAAGKKPQGLPDGVDSDQLIRELEDFLRKQREGGEEAR